MQTLNAYKKNGQGSIILRVKLYDSSVTTQAGKAAMTFNRPASLSPRGDAWRGLTRGGARSRPCFYNGMGTKRRMLAAMPTSLAQFSGGRNFTFFPGFPFG